MRFICEVCPTTASEGQAVIIGHYEKWIQHLLTPQHQLEQNLVMTRTSYWPDANWIVMIKNLPPYDKASTELYMDVMMKLSEYGFIEAIYYGSKIDSVCAAMQMHETQALPPYLQALDNTKYDIKVAPRFSANFALNGLNAAKIVKRRSRFFSTTPRAASDEESSACHVATSPISKPGTPPQGMDCMEDGLEKMTLTAAEKQDEIIGQKAQNRIKYDRDTLLQFRYTTSMPPKFSEVLSFPKHIIEEEKELVDPLFIQKLQNIKWLVQDENNPRSVYHNVRGNQPRFSRALRNQTGCRNNANNNIRCKRNEQQQQQPMKVDSDDELW